MTHEILVRKLQLGNALPRSSASRRPTSNAHTSKRSFETGAEWEPESSPWSIPSSHLRACRKPCAAGLRTFVPDRPCRARQPSWLGPRRSTWPARFQRCCSAPLFHSTVTRLLVEPNRSLGHPRLFSEFTAALDESARRSIISAITPRIAIASKVGSNKRSPMGRRCCISACTHSRPTGTVNRAPPTSGCCTIPRTNRRKRFATRGAASLQLRPDLRVRRNYPYLGKSDGLTTELRRRFGAKRYHGIELELNQLWPHKPAAEWRQMKHALIDSFQQALADRGWQ